MIAAIGQYLATTLIATTVLMMLVLALRPLAVKAVGARRAYWLWALPALRLLLPPVAVGSALDITRGPVVLARGLAPSTPDLPASMSVWSIPLVAIWAGGALFYLLWHAARYRRLRSAIEAMSRDLDETGRIRVVETRTVQAPVALGVLRPLVAMPPGWSALVGPHAAALSLDHELEHHRRGDIAANWVALLALALHWFNPIAWLAYRAFRSDQERATDAAVLARHGRAAIGPYARAIAVAAAGPTFSPACHLTTANDLKRRLNMLSIAAPSKRRRAIGTVALSAAAVIALTASTAAPRTAAATSTAPRTLVVETGAGNVRTLLVGRDRIAVDAARSQAIALPTGFDPATACNDVGTRGPVAYVIKGENGEQNYTVSCTATFGQSGEAASRISRRQAIAGLAAARTSIEAQTAVPAAERARILASIDASVADLR